jgi:hypothetical protein
MGRASIHYDNYLPNKCGLTGIKYFKTSPLLFMSTRF